jgi:hypothetical protein
MGKIKALIIGVESRFVLQRKRDKSNCQKFTKMKLTSVKEKKSPTPPEAEKA